MACITCTCSEASPTIELYASIEIFLMTDVCYHKFSIKGIAHRFIHCTSMYTDHIEISPAIIGHLASESGYF